MRRRSFLIGAATAAAAGLAGYHRTRITEVPANVTYPGMQVGHLLRDGVALPSPGVTRQHDVVILGAGISGLSCAWKLAREGYKRFVVVQGPEFGGNAAGGYDDDLAYPLGAHYLPLPSLESTHVREMLADFGIILDGATTARPYYDESILAHAPQERLYRNGRWEDGLLPMTGLPQSDQAQHRRFIAYTERLREARGQDGRKVFAIPLVLSSLDPAWRALDRLTFEQWLEREQYTSSALRWYLDYCMRDDYGAGIATVSAWAGLHYFASRDGHAANAADAAVLTWPDGLAPLTYMMRDAITRHLGHADWLLPGSAARVTEHRTGSDVLCIKDTASVYTIRASRVVCAMPLFVAQHLLPEIRDYGYDPASHASPHAAWLVSNFHMKSYPGEAEGEPLAWDNVVYQGKALGYVVSTHQLLRVARSPRTVFSAYQALSRLSPAQARNWLTQATPALLRTESSADLLAVYGEDLWRHVYRLDITVRGHAMATPTPGYLNNAGLHALRDVDGPILFAHADLSGYSVFEEAAWWGIQAARKIVGI